MSDLLKVDHVLLCMLYTFAHCLRNFLGFADAETYLAHAVSDNYKYAETEPLSAFDDLAYPVDGYYAL